MDPLWIAIAFIFGFIARQIGLPPLIGFLAAGFVLNYLGVTGGETLDRIANFGVQLLLFSIGLKLKVKDLLRPVIWATASIHMLIIVVLFGSGLFLLSFTGLKIIADLSLNESFLVAFGLSFSSTVFAVKILEEKGTLKATYGKIAIGILIMQDLFAVIFLALSSGKLPSPWAFGLVLLIAIPALLKTSVISAILNRSGHGELLFLLGILIPYTGALLFKSVGLKPDLGALTLGILLAGHPKSNELSNAMLGFKDVFLVGFFLTIGLSALPTLEALGISLLVTIAIPIKVALFFFLLTRFRLRSRNATLTSFSLANYSEFGLIVGAAGIANGLLHEEWLLIFALSLSITFILATPLNITAFGLYSKWRPCLKRFESEKRLPDDEPLETGNAEIIIFGMGAVGTSAYEVIKEKYHKRIIGIDCEKGIVEEHLAAGRQVLHGDATDEDFWQRVKPIPSIALVMVAISNHSTQLEIVRKVRKYGDNIKISAVCGFDDEMEDLKRKGAEIVFNIYSESGAGYADHTMELLYKES